jgi:hypothetical protein
VAGAVPLLVQVLRDHPAGGGVRVQAARALWALAENSPENNKAVIQALVSVLRDGSEIAQEIAATVLGKLALGDEARQSTISSSGAIPPLVQMLRDHPAASIALDQALGVLALVCAKDSSAVVAAGAIPILVSILADGSGEDAKLLAAGMLNVLAMANAENKKTIAAAGAIPLLLVQFLRDRAGSQFSMWGQAARVLNSLAADCPENSYAIATGVLFRTWSRC